MGVRSMNAGHVPARPARHRGIRTGLLAACVLAVAAGAVRADPPRGARRDPPKVTRWKDELGRPEPRPASVPDPGYGALKLTPEPSARRGLRAPPAGSNRVCIVVHTNIYGGIRAGLESYKAALTRDGFTPAVYIYTSGTAEALRSYLAGLYGEAASLVGVVLIGQIPYTIFENSYNFGDGETYESFPCDLFYMDLDGTWQDLTNGVGSFTSYYDTHTGDTNLEVWACRMKPDRITGMGPETNIMTQYFTKNRRFRSGQYAPLRRGLVYNDDDWINLLAEDSDHVSWLFGEISMIPYLDTEYTTADDYKTNQLTSSYHLMFVRSHGAATYHLFRQSGGDFAVYQSDYRLYKPEAVAHSLFICSGCDFSAYNNLGAVISLNTNESGVVCWGSTKTGGMWDGAVFYDALIKSNCVGEAFRRWFNAVQSWYPEVCVPWWYGMVVLGDGAARLDLADPVPTNGNAHLAQPVMNWQTIPGGRYYPEQCDGLYAQNWTAAGAVVTSADYSVTVTDTNPTGAQRMYRLVRDATPGPSNMLHNGNFEMPGSSTDEEARYWQWDNPDTHGSTWGGNHIRVKWRYNDGQGWEGMWQGVIAGDWYHDEYGSGWFQEKPALVGSTYQASAWFWADRGTYGYWTAAVQQLKIEFYSNTYGGPISVVATSLNDVGENWTYKSVTTTAPPNAAWARFVIGCDDIGQDGALQFDDCEMILAP